MTTQEFSNGFDTQIAAYNARIQFGEQASGLSFDEFEKSWFLTRAQEQLIIAYYNGSMSASFEETEELRRYLNNLIETAFPQQINVDAIPVSENSKFYKLPSNLLFITFESIQLETEDCLNGSYINVIPVTQDDYFRISRNPFRQSNSRKALRLDISNDIVEIVSKFDGVYSIRYIKRPKPIILAELEDITIDDEYKVTECELNKALHHRILDNAVAMAIASKTGGSQK